MHQHFNPGEVDFFPGVAIRRIADLDTRATYTGITQYTHDSEPALEAYGKLFHPGVLTFQERGSTCI